MNDTVGNYRKAAEAALEQLDWAINHLYRLHKHEIATVLSQNRDQIRRRLGAAKERDASTLRNER